MSRGRTSSGLGRTESADILCSGDVGTENDSFPFRRLLNFWKGLSSLRLLPDL